MKVTFKKLILPIVFIILLVIAIFSEMPTAISVDPAPSRPPVSRVIPVVAVGTVDEAQNIEPRRYTGLITPVSRVSITPRVNGDILEVGFRDGSFVKKGDLLYQLDPVRYDAAVRSAEASVAENRAKAAYAESNFNRYQNLYRQNAETRDSMESARSEYEAAQAALLAAEATLITAQDDLKNSRILAPIDGKIGVSAYTAGNYVTSASGTLVTIVRTDPLRVSFSMSNRDFLAMFRTEENLKETAFVQLRLADDSVYDLPGTVEFIDNHADERSDTITVYAVFDNPDNILIPDGTVTVMLMKDNGDTLPAVPPSAVMYDANAAYVYVVDGQNRVERRDVVLGFSGGMIQLVKAGLTAGETIVTDGMHKTASGELVEPKYEPWRLAKAF